MGTPPRNGSGPRPHPGQSHAAELLALGHPQRFVARQSGVSERSIRDWLHKPEFAAMVTEYRQGFVGQALDRLRAQSGRLIDKLLALTDSDDEKVVLAALRDALDRAGISFEAQLKLRQVEASERQAQTGEDLLSQLVGQGWVCAPPGVEG